MRKIIMLLLLVTSFLWAEIDENIPSSISGTFVFIQKIFNQI